MVVVPVVPDPHEEVRRVIHPTFAVLLVQFQLDAAREGHGLSTVPRYGMVLELLLDAFGRGEVEEGQHWSYSSIVTTDNCQFDIAFFSLNHFFHVLKGWLENRRAKYSGQMFRIKQNEKVVLNVF